MTESPIESPGMKPHRRKKEFAPTVDRLPPHSPEAEQGVLGCVMLEPMHCIGLCDEAFHGRDVFYDHRHKEIFKAAKYLCDNEHGFDLVTLQNQLKKHKLLESIGGVEYLASLPDMVPSSANLSYYLKIVQEKYEMRQAVQNLTLAINDIYDCPDNAEVLKSLVRGHVGNLFDDESAAKCERFSISDLDNFDLNNDPDNLIGNRYLTRGSSLMVNGPSGRGKSSLLMLRIIKWALGQPFYGVKVMRPLTAVIFQTENNEGDLAQAFQGARNFLNLNSFDNPEEFELLEKNVEFIYCPALSGQEFLQFAQRELTKKPRDLAVLDPLVSFPEGDLNSAQGAGEFLRKGLSKISFFTRVTWIINHHTPKPLRDPKAKTVKKLASDYQYSGAGSFDIAGWARASETLHEHEDGRFRLVFAKRGGHGACHPDGQPTIIIWLKHAYDGGIHWEQEQPEEESEESESRSDREPSKAEKGGRPGKLDRLMGIGLGPIIDALITPISKNALAKQIEMHAAKNSLDVKETVCKSAVEKLVENRAITKTEQGYVKC